MTKPKEKKEPLSAKDVLTIIGCAIAVVSSVAGVGKAYGSLQSDLKNEIATRKNDSETIRRSLVDIKQDQVNLSRQMASDHEDVARRIENSDKGINYIAGFLKTQVPPPEK